VDCDRASPTGRDAALDFVRSPPKATAASIGKSSTRKRRSRMRDAEGAVGSRIDFWALGVS
jgi:hypothetical protein